MKKTIISSIALVALMGATPLATAQTSQYLASCVKCCLIDYPFIKNNGHNAAQRKARDEHLQSCETYCTINGGPCYINKQLKAGHCNGEPTPVPAKSCIQNPFSQTNTPTLMQSITNAAGAAGEQNSTTTVVAPAATKSTSSAGEPQTIPLPAVGAPLTATTQSGGGSSQPAAAASAPTTSSGAASTGGQPSADTSGAAAVSGDMGAAAPVAAAPAAAPAPAPAGASTPANTGAATQ